LPKSSIFKSIGFCVSAILVVATLVGCGAIFGHCMPRKGRPQFGKASWYGEKYHGRKTACGEIFDMHKLTAAHLSLPLVTIVKVTNLENGKSVVVKVNDRGPYVRGRIIDLSYAAAKKIGMLEDGVAKVKIEIVD
jgi:rare lipoprotein A